MFYMNNLTIKMENKKAAAKALEIMRKRLEAGFEIDETYRGTPSTQMAKDLMIKKNTIILPDDNGYYMAEDIIEIIEELLVCIAIELKAKFSCENYNSGTYRDSGIEAVFDNGILRIEKIQPVIDVKEIKIY